MAKWGKVDYKQLEKVQKKLEQYEKVYQQEFFEAAAKELAARLLAKVIKRTPVGQYPGIKGKTGGTLRRGWTGGNRSSAQAYANDLKVTRNGNMYQIEIINPVMYAMYVEYGHRTRDHLGWVPGRFMMTISAQEIQEAAPSILEKKLEKYLIDTFGKK